MKIKVFHTYEGGGSFEVKEKINKLRALGMDGAMSRVDPAGNNEHIVGTIPDEKLDAVKALPWADRVEVVD